MEGGLEGMDSSASEKKDASKCKCQYERCEACGFCCLQFFRGFSYFLMRWRNAMEGHLRTALNLRRREVLGIFLSTLSSVTFLLIVSLLNLHHGSQKSCEDKLNANCEELEESDSNAKTSDRAIFSDTALSRDANTCYENLPVHSQEDGEEDVYQEDGDEVIYEQNDENDIIFLEDGRECSSRSSCDANDWSDDSEGENVNDGSMQCEEDDIWSDEDLISSTHLKGFPPPISILANETHPGLPEHMSRTFWRSVKRGGRFVLQEVQAQPNEFFLATRNNGRLVLELVRTDLDSSGDGASGTSLNAEESLEVDLGSDLDVHNERQVEEWRREEDSCCEDWTAYNEKLVEEGRREDLQSRESEELSVINENIVEEWRREDSCSGQSEDAMCQTSDEYILMNSRTTCEILDSTIPEALKSNGKLDNGNALCENMPCEMTAKTVSSEDIPIPLIKESQPSLKVDLDRYSCSKAMIQACT